MSLHPNLYIINFDFFHFILHQLWCVVYFFFFFHFCCRITKVYKEKKKAKYMRYLFFFFFFWERKMGAFMVILHPRAGCRSEVDSWGWSQHQQHQRPCGGSTPLRMPTNGFLRVTGLEPRCVARSVRVLPTQPSPRWQIHGIS